MNNDKNTAATTEDFSLKTMLQRPERLTPGHRLCAGCGATIGIRAVLRALHEEDRAVIGNATGCVEVSSYMYPYTAWEDSYIHNAFENAGATLSGVETAYRALRKRGRLPEKENFKFITFGGDGGTYDTIRKLEPKATVLTGLPVEMRDAENGPAKAVEKWLKSLSTLKETV